MRAVPRSCHCPSSPSHHPITWLSCTVRGSGPQLGTLTHCTTSVPVPGVTRRSSQPSLQQALSLNFLPPGQASLTDLPPSTPQQRNTSLLQAAPAPLWNACAKTRTLFSMESESLPPLGSHGDPGVPYPSLHRPMPPCPPPPHGIHPPPPPPQQAVRWQCQSQSPAQLSPTLPSGVLIQAGANFRPLPTCSHSPDDSNEGDAPISTSHSTY